MDESEYLERLRGALRAVAAPAEGEYVLTRDLMAAVRAHHGERVLIEDLNDAAKSLGWVRVARRKRPTYFADVALR